MGSAKYCTSIHIHSRYWQYRIVDKDILKTAFLMTNSLHKWLVMPMGLTNALTTFLHTVNDLFSEMLDFSMALFLDDMLI